MLYTVHGHYALRGGPLHQRLISFLQASVLGVVGIGAALYLGIGLRPLEQLLAFVLPYALLHMGLTSAVRWGVIGWRHHQLKADHWRPLTLLIGGGARAVQLLAELDRSPEPLRPHFVGYLDTAKSATGAYAEALVQRLPRLGHVDDLEQILLRRELDVVLMAPDRLTHDHFLQAVRLSRPFGLVVMLPPDLFDFTVGSYRLTRVLSTPLIELRLRVSEPFEAVVKRVVDVAVSAVLLFLLLPLLLVLLVLILMNTPGPALYRQVRVGRRGHSFTLLKFRTMWQDAEANGPQLTQPHDPRITPLGRWMRRHHLDELPQLWNVLMGEMSLVGPRPERAVYLEQIRKVAPEVDHVLHVRPGIIGWAQLTNGYARTLDQMLARLRYDLLYVQHQSWVLDLKIGLLSLRRVIKGEPD